jgi:hypothetical protein
MMRLNWKKGGEKFNAPGGQARVAGKMPVPEFHTPVSGGVS